MIVHEPRRRPEAWRVWRERHRKWLSSLLAFEWLCDWAAYYLSRWNFIEVLEYLEALSVLVAVIFYFADSGNRIKQRHFQAWQVINTAQGKGGSGGRIDALQELNQDKVPLVGVNVAGAFLQGLNLERAELDRANFNSADVRNSDFEAADFSDSDLGGANFRESNLRRALLKGSSLQDADLSWSDLTGADISGVSLQDADLRYTDLSGIKWQNVSSIKLANLYGVKNAPPEFLSWALQNGAVQIKSDAEWQQKSGGQ
jgi:Pentapeptide repeats (8 copies)